MKTFVYFIFTLCISCGCLVAATNTKNPNPLFAAAFGIWILFFYNWHRRLQREAEQRNREQKFQEHMRNNYHHH